MATLDKKTLADKTQLHEIIVAQMRQNLDDIVRSAQAAHGGATHEDAVAKSKYDTHGLELSYLAGSQFERANLLRADIVSFSALKPTLFDKDQAIGVSCLVSLESIHPNQKKLVFLSPYGAGMTVNWQTSPVSIVSPESPLGVELVDSFAGDEIEAGSQTLEIISIL
ncbi:hypothetical protein [Pseudobacteriovorax antillogorgiicola]|uniref:GreA/GreB family elongation factor n=1 Tax=Pseudobacteriovorax antillogorgiicola TaxID=1513793 RepID=A0A1Y6C9Q7_9BACT|nr:hypothetical protein [Pseudobacteriovorax antillogorgiicola]TCS51710.1 GreA/GreB family elongation factor [Pseudobacteriovorax antillogorgiicola]SMF49310.1 GreA/GreB family elongation factor [Pseudobacteriovorax antillogorgiicola]